MTILETPLDIALTQDILKPIDRDHCHKSAEMKFRERDIIWVQSSTPFQYKKQVDLMIEEALDFVLLERRSVQQGGTTEIVFPQNLKALKGLPSFRRVLHPPNAIFPATVSQPPSPSTLRTTPVAQKVYFSISKVLKS
jgi:hypothetical protein